MTGNSIKMEILSGPERRRRWSTAEKLAIVHETYEADATVSLVARRHGIAPSQLFAWCKLTSEVATAAEEEVVHSGDQARTPDNAAADAGRIAVWHSC